MEKIEYDKLTYQVDPGQDFMRLDLFLLARIEGISRSKVQNRIEEQLILVNDKVVKSNYKIKPHDVITVFQRRSPHADGMLAEDIGGLDIKYEDEDLLIINKPTGMVVHPGIGNHSGTLANGLLHHLKNLDLPQNGQERPGIVHRIDKNTSGLLVIAKTELAMQELAKRFFNHDILRRYRVLVWGNVEAEEGTIKAAIGRNPRFPKLRAVVEKEEDGKPSTTHYKVLRRYGYVTLLECRLETGRTHQIRVHFQHIGHPVFGDFEYGGDKIIKGTIFTKYKQFVQNCFKLMPHQSLHAFSLGFLHPRSGEPLYFEAELPANFADLLKKWENYTQGRINIPQVDTQSEQEIDEDL
jgi:23S rRNA pseudouridine1911/1915/1917 synthase